MKTAKLTATIIHGRAHFETTRILASETANLKNHNHPNSHRNALSKSLRSLLICSCLFSGGAFAAVQTHGPVAGGVTQEAADIFVRTNATGSVRIEYATNPDLTDASSTGDTTTSVTKDFTTHMRLTNLSPGSVYYYRVLVDGQAQQVAPYPKFRTFPTIEQAGEFRFAVASDVQNSATKPTTRATVYEKVRNDNPAFLLQLGDLDHSNPNTFRLMRTMNRRLQGPETGYGVDFIANIGTQMPFYHVWDDHDIGSNNADKTFSGKANALKAFAEYYSTSLLPNPSAGVWHSFRHGEAEFFMVDVRSQRDIASDPENSDKSMLDGDNLENGQKAWLFNGLLNSTAKWKFIMSGVPFNKSTKSADSWAAYQTERNELLTFLHENQIHGVIVISGDLHSGGAIDSGVNADLPEMSVPHTNLVPAKFLAASGPEGTWDLGFISGVGEQGQGYSLVTVKADQVIMEIKNRNGDTILSHSVQ